ncbi:MAG TPA: hypothetical protein VFG34_10575 [Sphingopyxis sp.]|nr:hypothetical protein [Sphingopyxis sp.]
MPDLIFQFACFGIVMPFVDDVVASSRRKLWDASAFGFWRAAKA